MITVNDFDLCMTFHKMREKNAWQQVERKINHISELLQFNSFQETIQYLKQSLENMICFRITVSPIVVDQDVFFLSFSNYNVHHFNLVYHPQSTRC